MPADKLHIEQFLEFATRFPVIDVRSPGEYNHAHIPGAFNIPVFSDAERAEVGTAYKQVSREEAIRIGLSHFGPKMRLMVETVDTVFQNHFSKKQNRLPESAVPAKNILIYCWRGGMRSAALAWLLDLYGYKVYLLTGGYKKFRNKVLETFQENFSLKILGGYTGSGKTEVLKELERLGETIIDLEDLAKHKGSAFGNIGMPQQPSQEMFENLLASSLWAAQKKANGNPIWVEDESQRIGLVNLPNEFWKTMRRSQLNFLDISFEDRLTHIAEEYGSLDQQRMIDAIGRIRERLGGLEAKNAIGFLENGNTRDCFRILLTYYDKWYYKALHNREELNSLLKTIKCDSVTPQNAYNLIQQPEYHDNA